MCWFTTPQVSYRQYGNRTPAHDSLNCFYTLLGPPQTLALCVMEVCTWTEKAWPCEERLACLYTCIPLWLLLPLPRTDNSISTSMSCGPQPQLATQCILCAQLSLPSSFVASAKHISIRKAAVVLLLYSTGQIFVRMYM
jgi:hypothetical protein